ncbi:MULTISPECIES: DUF2187 family protein [unclassified Psychrobacillus]|uniref:DUF2187 family protein n=1 Tax=unclassified Psychrobacillus TaxID=2636677 RepID=UPI0030FB23AE
MKKQIQVVAAIGNIVAFERKGKLIEGLVISVLEKSVVVEVSLYDQLFLSLDNDRTVVNYKKVSVVS